MANKVEHKQLIGKLDDLKGWIKDVHSEVKQLNKKVAVQNGRIYQNEKDIALVKQAGKHRDKHIYKIEEWSRTKLITVGTIGISVIMFLIQILVEIVKERIMQ